MNSETNGLASELRDYLMYMFAGDAKGKIVLKGIPSARRGSQYVRITVGEEPNQRRYVAKAWVCRDSGGALQLLRSKRGKHPALFEARLIKTYYNNGAHVPSIPYEYPPTENILVMTDLGDNSPEKAFSVPNLSQRDAKGLAVKVAEELIKFHSIGGAHQSELIDVAPEGLLKPRYDKRAREYHRLLASTEDDLREELGGERRRKILPEKEFDDWIEVVARNIGGAGAQLIHGDMTDYHLRIGPDGEMYAIDLGSPRFNMPRCIDSSDFLFSPGVPLSLEAKTEVYEGYARDSALAEISGILTTLDRDYLNQEGKRFLFATLFEALRRSAISKEMRVTNPADFVEFSKQHPAYANPIPHYIKTVDEVTTCLLDNQKKYKLLEGDARVLDESRLLLLSLIGRGRPERALDPDEILKIDQACNGLPGIRRNLRLPRKKPRLTCEIAHPALSEGEKQVAEGRRMAEKEAE